MKRFLGTLALAVLLAVDPVQAEEKPVVAGKLDAADAEPMSIFNAEIRCFKFKIEHAVVTIDEAVAFMERYNNKENPPIIGAIPDTQTNSLCVIGPPEAETAIRKSLATWIIEMQGIPGTPLVLKKRVLQADREEMLTNLAEMELVLVDVANEENKKLEIQARIEAFEAELAVIEKKLKIVDKYLKRIEEEPRE